MNVDTVLIANEIIENLGDDALDEETVIEWITSNYAEGIIDDVIDAVYNEIINTFDYDEETDEFD